MITPRHAQLPIVLIGGISIVIFAIGWFAKWPLILTLIMVFRVILPVVGTLYGIIPIFLVGYCVGKHALHITRRCSTFWSMCCYWMLGCATFVFFGTVLLLFGIYYTWIWHIVAFVLNVGSLLWAMRLRWRPLIELWEFLSDASRKFMRQTTFWRVLIYGILLLALCHAIIPPNTRDELVYHLSIPNLWEFQHNWWMNTDNFHLSFPANVEILWAYALALAGVQAPRLLTLGFALFTLTTMSLCMFKQNIPRRIRDMSLLFFLVTPVIMVMSAITYVEWPLFFFILFGWYSSHRYLMTQERKYAYAASIAWAIALGGKYSAIVIVGLLSLEWLYRCYCSFRSGIGHLLLSLFLAVSVLMVPWLARDYVVTGDPIYPLGQALLPAPQFLESEAYGFRPEYLTNHEEISGIWRFYPLLYHMTADRKTDNRVHVGWLFLHVGVIVLGWKRRKELPWLTVVIASVFFALFTPSPRIYTPLMAVMWLFLPSFLKTCTQQRISRVFVSGMLCVVVLSSMPLSIHYWFMTDTRASQDYLLGMLTANGLLIKDSLLTPVMNWVRQETEPSARIWLWGSDRIFYFDRWVRPSPSYAFPTFLDILQREGQEGLSHEIIDDDIHYIVIDTANCSLSERLFTTEKNTWSITEELSLDLHEWMKQNLQLLHKDYRFELYQIQKQPT